MKKLVIAVITVLCAVLSVSAYAQDEPLFRRVGVHICVDQSAEPASKIFTFDLRDPETGAILDSRQYAAEENAPVIDLEFNVPPYSAGKSFVLHMSQGQGEITYNETSGAYFELQTYSYPGEAGGLLYGTDFYMTLKPQIQKKTELILGGAVRNDVPVYSFPNGLLIPASALESLDIKNEPTADGGLMLYAGSKSMLFYPGQRCAYKNSQAFNLELEPGLIDGALYVPVGETASYFGCPAELTDNAEEFRLVLGRSPEARTEDEILVDSKGLTSETDYLVWVSKSEYTVRVYQNAGGSWRNINSFRCAIGAPGTPTCEGIYKYYQYQDRWCYPNYYCGPIMRFNGGYAIHSTLRRYNGTDYDGRVGMKISHGCIRVRPENISWLVQTVPLRSTIYVTA